MESTSRMTQSKRSSSPTKSSPGELRALQVIDRLTVGPVKIEPRKVTAPYTVKQGGSENTFEFAYNFEEDVFIAGDEVERNLAAMMGAQVALNYGMFCREIVFRGPYDKTDQRFIAEMAENTAREIYVKKILEPNPFLIGAARDIPARKLPAYSTAKLIFEGEVVTATNGRIPTGAWARGDDRYLILSSGGKDSLLSYGLLKEIGGEVHPIYVNESGKHWFTALNAYRHFAEHVPHTGRVWTNADRLFSWMLRHFPFVRQDFANVRADEYPIRLWTVAVFLFGVLPMARSRGLGRVIIGDEFDTTERATHEGITHYSGLFDQSRYFDDTLTRYYAAKGWGMQQFSILRPLSELLIEKILAERYPELLRLQTSCHATHKEGDRVRPCGKCEKCRRIAAMLAAVGQDPSLCGYDPAQVEQCLREVVKRGLHQEREGTQHLGVLLRERGLIADDKLGDLPIKPQPHVLQLRFDRERSLIEGIPADIRKRLYPILLKHADGAVKKTGRVWMPINPLASEFLARAYAFEKKRTEVHVAKETTSPPTQEGREYILGELTWQQAEARLKEVDIALLPVGAVEQHGPHLPLDTDAFDAEYLSMEVAKACNRPRPLVLPLIPYGVSYHHDDFRGTLSVSNETLSRLVYEIGMGIARNGVTKLIIINGHGGNAATLNFAAQMINRDAHIFTCVDTGETSDTDIDSVAETPGDVHAGEIETSTSLVTRPHLVDMSKAQKSVQRFSSRYLDFSSKRSVDWYARTKKLSKSGVMGDATKATREKGEKIWKIMIDNLVEFVEHLRDMSLDEIHQRNRF